MKNSIIMVLTALLSMSLATAQTRADKQRPELPDAPPPTIEQHEEPLPPKQVGPDQPAPTVNIRTEDGQIIEEYQVNGETYMVKITPEKGIPYYLIDTDGDGEFDTKEFDQSNGIRPVYYKLFEWK